MASYAEEMRATLESKRARPLRGSQVDRKAAALAPNLPMGQVSMFSASTRAFSSRLAKLVDKLVLSELPVLGSGDPLDRAALEQGLANVESQIEGLAEKARRVSLNAANRVEKAARAEALRLLKVDLPAQSLGLGPSTADRAVQRLRAAGLAQVNRIREAIQDYEEGTSLRQAILDTLWVSRVRGSLIARDEIYRHFRDSFAAFAILSGSAEGVYVTSKDDRVRDRHAANEGKRFAWSNPPDTLLEPNCRCRLVPVEAL